MKSKGFTLTELLAVIVILSVITAMATPAFYATSDNTKKSLYETKKDYIRIQTLKYLQEQDIESTTHSDSFKITVKTLIRSGYITPDKYINEGGEEIPFLVNPIDPEENLACREISITIEGLTYKANVLDSSNCSQ